jgi:hypothetical protein
MAEKIAHLALNNNQSLTHSSKTEHQIIKIFLIIQDHKIVIDINKYCDKFKKKRNVNISMY